MTRDTFAMEADYVLKDDTVLMRLVLSLMKPEQKSMLYGLEIKRDEISLRIMVRIAMLFDGPEGLYQSCGMVEVAEYAAGYDVSTIVHRVLKRVDIMIKEAGK